MTRWLFLASAFVLVASLAVSGQARQGGPARGGGAGQSGGRAGGQGRGDQNPELQRARDQLQRDIAEGKRLQEQLKTDRKSGDRDAVRRDNDAIKRNREDVKRDQERIKEILSNRKGRGRSSEPAVSADR
jgi:hypothetical protein